MASVLVIDDEDNLRAALRRNLQKSGYHVVEASEGRQAIQLLGNTQVDLVLVDIFMPGKEGLETIRELRQSYPNIPVIAMSGGGSKGMADVLHVAKMFGARRALLKPFSGQELIEAVQHELGHV